MATAVATQFFRALGADWVFGISFSDGDRAALMALVRSSFFRAVARGIYVSLSVLYVATVNGDDTASTARMFLIVGAAGLIGSLIGGFASDLIDPRTLLLWSGWAIAGSYFAVLLIDHILWLGVAFAVIAFLDRSLATTQATWVGRAIPGEAAAKSRALQRSVANLGMALGAQLSVLVIMFLPVEVYLGMFMFIGLLEVAGTFSAMKIPKMEALSQRVASAQPMFGVMTDLVFVLFVFGSAVLYMMYMILDYLLPVWIAKDGMLPQYFVPVALTVNTILVLLMQVRIANRFSSSRSSARALSFGASSLLTACVAFWAVVNSSGIVSMVCFFAAVAILTMGELLISVATWNLSYAYAPPARIGAYQGVFGLGTSIGVAVAPPVLTLFVIDDSGQGGGEGWLFLGLLFSVTSGILAMSTARSSPRRSSKVEFE